MEIEYFSTTENISENSTWGRRDESNLQTFKLDLSLNSDFKGGLFHSFSCESMSSRMRPCDPPHEIDGLGGSGLGLPNRLPK